MLRVLQDGVRTHEGVDHPHAGDHEHVAAGLVPLVVHLPHVGLGRGDLLQAVEQGGAAAARLQPRNLAQDALVLADAKQHLPEVPLDDAARELSRGGLPHQVRRAPAHVELLRSVVGEHEEPHLVAEAAVVQELPVAQPCAQAVEVAVEVGGRLRGHWSPPLIEDVERRERDAVAVCPDLDLEV